MKLFLILIFLSMLSLNCGSFSTKAQIRANANGTVINSNSNNKPVIKLPPLDITKVDFKNFIYPELLTGTTNKTFTLKNGQYRSGKPLTQRVYTLLKTYYFDITDDGKDEAVTYILGEGCGEGCDSHSLFYVHTVENNQLKLIWKIATGAEALGGLKSVAFKNKQIILESFGNCTLQNSLITASFDPKNPKKILLTDYTQFTFSLNKNYFSQSTKNILPLEDKNIAGYRVQISFGEQE